MILLKRYYSPFGIHGDLEVEGHTFSTLEKSWKGNEQSVSCIPEGNFTMEMRSSPVVQRTSGFSEGWQVMDVPGRTYIMFHPGSWTKDTAGCILIGTEKDIVDNKLFLRDSQEAFKRFMELLDSQMQWEIQIRPWRLEYP